MMLDGQNLFSDAQVVTANANSTNAIDRVGAGSLGAGEPLHLVTKVGTVSGTSPTLTINLVGADDSGFSTNKITIASVTPTIAAAQADALVRMGIPHHTPKRYLRLEFVVSGTSPSVTVTSGLVKDEQTTSMT